MKKTFYQLHPIFLLLLCFVMPMVGCGVYMFVAAFYHEIYWILLLAIPFTLFSGYYGIYAPIYHHIKFDTIGIHVSTDKLEKDAKIQYETHIAYEDICQVRIIKSIKNSEKKFIESMAISSNSLKTYLEFTLVSGKTEWIFIMYFSKKQRIKILEIISEKTKLNLNYQTLMNEIKLA